jgi:hypothetical protein
MKRSTHAALAKYAALAAAPIAAGEIQYFDTPFNFSFGGSPQTLLDSENVNVTATVSQAFGGTVLDSGGWQNGGNGSHWSAIAYNIRLNGERQSYGFLDDLRFMGVGMADRLAAGAAIGDNGASNFAANTIGQRSMIRIDSFSSWTSNGTIYTGAFQTTVSGGIVGGDARFLVGFSFVEQGTGNLMNFGWMDIELIADELGNEEFIIHRWAYEDSYFQGINAGEIPAPGALGLIGLAAGAAGIRRKRSA